VESVSEVETTGELVDPALKAAPVEQDNVPRSSLDAALVMAQSFRGLISPRKICGSFSVGAAFGTFPGMSRRLGPLHLVVALFALSTAGCGHRRDGGDDDDDDDTVGDGDADADADADTDGDADSDSDADADSDIGSPYDEDLCADADLSAIEADFSPGSWEDVVLPVLDARYDVGAYVLRESPQDGGCQWANFVGDSSSFSGVLQGLETIVHEMGHCWGFQFLGAEYAYLVTPDRELHVTWLQNFPRSEILGVHEFGDDDFYRDTYLTGQSGNQGFNTVLDELNQYIHSLAVAYCYADYRGAFSTSARDGVWTFLYYVEKYLQVGRTDHPTDYAAITGDPGTVEVIDTLWGRAQLYLAVTAADDRLGLNDEMIQGYVEDPANLEELRRVLP